MARDEPMMAAASYFWSRALNTFLFSQGPMTPTLLDSIMITGLDVTSSANLSSLDTQLTHEFKTRSIGGWTSYVAKNMGTGPISPREHAAFPYDVARKIPVLRSKLWSYRKLAACSRELGRKEALPPWKILVKLSISDSQYRN
jgi:hypothetical protein